MARNNRKKGMKKGSKSQWSITFLRIVLGVLFIYHGYFKLIVQGGLPSTAEYFSSLGIPFPNIFAVIVAYVEFFGGILLVVGLLTRYTSFILMIDMAVALFVAHWPKGFNVYNGGYEMVLVIFAGLFVTLNSSSKLALANILKNKRWR